MKLTDEWENRGVSHQSPAFGWGCIKSPWQGHSELVSESQAIDNEILKHPDRSGQDVQDDFLNGKTDF